MAGPSGPAGLAGRLAAREVGVETEHLVDITPTDRADGRFAAACSCGEHAESRSAALLDAWVAFHLARDTTSRVTTTPRGH